MDVFCFQSAEWGLSAPQASLSVSNVPQTAMSQHVCVLVYAINSHSTKLELYWSQRAKQGCHHPRNIKNTQ